MESRHITCLALVLMVICGILLGMGIDGEVKAILTLAAGWIFGSGSKNIYRRVRNNRTQEARESKQ